MPSIKIKSSTGKGEFRYNIATPFSANAKSIEKNLPTVLMLHPVYIPQEIYHSQHVDPKLRRFNLVTLDYRMHGETTGQSPTKKYGQVEAAEDVAEVMRALKLPACHVVGLSLGTIIGLQLAISYPDKVQSLFLMSPLGLEEPEDVANGRIEIYDYWCQGYGKGGKVDDLTLIHAFYGALQLGFSNRSSPLINALSKRVYALATKTWTPPHFEAYRAATLDIFIQRKRHSRDALSALKNIPIALVHGLADVAYPLSYTQEFMKQLQNAGVQTQLYKVADQPHFLNIDISLPEPEVNSILHDFLVKHADAQAVPVPKEVVSPWDAILRKYGWDPEEEEDNLLMSSLSRLLSCL
ncbi:hypothetical protein D9758_011412 [Tetrapyrgos nigripes]|uniref:AB hydrolase-1 domain-containing protein n=1 Tax=Tetrapyrgos nigripes TaxID=182062 RepID=A0A8H5CQ64_9AGAR|nr:hypothetical protein D9758_011412 [Tetrapyrgos nigripes]